MNKIKAAFEHETGGVSMKTTIEGYEVYLNFLETPNECAVQNIKKLLLSTNFTANFCQQ